MSWTCGFFNSVGEDRRYNADQMSHIFDGLITQGVYENVGKKLAVGPNSGMTIQIDTGRGWFGSRWVNNDSIYQITLEDADVLLNRYAAICVRCDLTDSVRDAYPYVKYSDFASSPTKPTMERTETVQEYCLAYVYIKGGASAITAADIEDTRANKNLCGWVTGLIDQVDTETLWNQWQALFSDFMALKAAEFTTWFNALQDVLSGDAEAKIAADLVTLNNRAKKITVTLDGLSWVQGSDGEYTQAVTAPGVTVDNEIIIVPADASKDSFISMGVTATIQASDSITFSAMAPDDVELTVKVIILNI